MKRAFFAGSFDPFTIGHRHVVEKAQVLFDQIVIGIGHNAQKQAMYDLETRKRWIETAYQNISMVTVVTYTGLTVDACEKHNCQFIVRGLRTSKDYEYESPIAQMNAKLAPAISTVYVQCDPEYTAINASIVRDIIKNGGDASQFVPREINL